MELKHFQDEYVEQLMSAVKRNLRSIEDNPDLPLQHIVFKSPTGSGKTIMMSEMLKRLSEDDIQNERNLVFLWLAPMKLHAQSYNKLNDNLRDSDYQLINIDNGLSSGTLKRNTILFSNWEKLTTTANQDKPEKDIKKGDWTNVATKQGETHKNLIDILAATREAGEKVILVVDESHQTFYGEKSQRFVREIVKPTLVIEVSATPKVKDNQSQVIEVPYGLVVESGLIKNQIIINNDLGKLSEKTSTKTIIENLVDLALSKREELRETYRAIDENVNPLILIQLPNDTSELMNELDKNEKKVIEEILATKGINYDNRKLAVWLSEEKKNLEGVKEVDSPVEVLIFKQAIALGWDCPRAQLLIMRRDVKSETFKIQTVGRVLRMPKAERYNSDLLNTAFVYSDLKAITIDKNETDPLVNLVKYQKSEIRKEFSDKNVRLPGSIYLSRIDYGDLRADFNKFLRDKFNDILGPSLTKGKDGNELTIDESKLTRPIIADEIVKQIDDISDRSGLKTVEMKMDPETIDYLFNLLLREFIKPFTGFARTRAVVYPTLRDLFASAGIEEQAMKRIFVCSTTNQGTLKKIFASAIDSYNSTNQREMKKRRDRAESIEDWSVPEIDSFSDNYAEVSMERNVYDHYYRKRKVSENETRFEDILDGDRNVLWWHKNGEKMRQHFAVGYYERLEDETYRRNSFYPDYIVHFIDGTIGIFETKSGANSSPDFYSNKNNSQKANALQRWMRDNSELGVWGGIVNRVKDSEFMLQGDAITQEMARTRLIGEEVELPEVDYDFNNWNRLEI